MISLLQTCGEVLIHLHKLKKEPKGLEEKEEKYSIILDGEEIKTTIKGGDIKI